MKPANISMLREDGEYEIFQGWVINEYWAVIDVQSYHTSYPFLIVHYPTGSASLFVKNVSTAEDVVDILMSIQTDWSNFKPGDELRVTGEQRDLLIGLERSGMIGQIS